jgi:DNA-binding MarR family transcriptional regulator
VDDELVDAVVAAVREYRRASDRLIEAANARMGINRTDGRALDAIQEAGAMTPGEIARASGLTTGAVTAVLDRLERAGYVRRTRDSIDRRKVIVEITDHARQFSDELFGPMAEGVAAFASLPTTELEAVLRFFRRITELEHLAISRATGHESSSSSPTTTSRSQSMRQ